MDIFSVFIKSFFIFVFFCSVGFFLFFFFCIRLYTFFHRLYAFFHRLYTFLHRLYTSILFHSVFFFLSVCFIGVTGFCGVSFFFLVFVSILISVFYIFGSENVFFGFLIFYFCYPCVFMIVLKRSCFVLWVQFFYIVAISQWVFHPFFFMFLLRFMTLSMCICQIFCVSQNWFCRIFSFFLLTLIECIHCYFLFFYLSL